MHKNLPRWITLSCSQHANPDEHKSPIALVKKLHHGWAIAALLIALSASAQSPPPNYDESKVGSYTLPDPLVFRNGGAVRNAGDWKRRRQEILELFQANVFGRSPRSKHARFEVFETGKTALDGKAVRKQVTIYFSAKKDGPKADLLIYIPAGARKPVPMFLTLNFWGNQSVVNDPGIRLPTIWDPKTHARQQASEDSRGRDTEFDIEKILARGYGFATICYQNIEPDFKGGYVDGIRPLFFTGWANRTCARRLGSNRGLGLRCKPRHGLSGEGQRC